MDLATLRTEFQRSLIRTDVTPAQIDSYLLRAQYRATRKLRVPINEKTVDYTIGDPYAHPLIPSDFQKAKALYMTSSGKTIRKKALKQILDEGTDNGSSDPSHYAREGNRFKLNRQPGTGTGITLVYWGGFDVMTADTDENLLAAVAPDVLIYGALVYAATDYADERKIEFEAQYQAHLQELMDMGEDDELGDGPLQIEPATDTEY